MLFAIVLTDAADSDDARKEHHAGHVAHFGANKANIALAGPMSDEQGNPTGSLVVFEAASAQDARTFVEGDPFHNAGVWKDVAITRFKASIHNPEKLG